MGIPLRTVPVPPRLDAASVAGLRAAIADVAGVRALVLRGASSQGFCAGLDLASLGSLDAASLRAGLDAYAALLLAIADAPLPVIAVVEGDAFGGGVGLASIADLVLATPDARFGLPEARHGFHPAIVLAALDRRLTPQRSRRLALQCESIGAAEAQAWGLVDEVVEPTALEASLARWSRRLARAAPDAVAALRAHAPHRERLLTALDAGVDATARALGRPEVRAAIAEALR